MGCGYSISGSDRKEKHEKKSTEQTILFIELLRQYYDASSEIKWLSLAHDFGRNIFFKYQIAGWWIYDTIEIIFEDPPDFSENDPVYKNEPIIERVYYFIPLVGNNYYITPYYYFTKYRNLYQYRQVYGQSKIFKSGSLNNILKVETGLHFSEHCPFAEIIEYKEMSAIESIDKRKNHLRGIINRIEEVLSQFILEHLPPVLVPIITGYYL